MLARLLKVNLKFHLFQIACTSARFSFLEVVEIFIAQHTGTIKQKNGLVKDNGPITAPLELHELLIQTPTDGFQRKK